MQWVCVCIWESGTEKAGGVERKEDKGEANIFETLSYAEIP